MRLKVTSGRNLERESSMAQYGGGDRVCETDRHFWNTRDKLGHGATGAVYVGYERVSAPNLDTISLPMARDGKGQQVVCLPYSLAN